MANSKLQGEHVKLDQDIYKYLYKIYIMYKDKITSTDKRTDGFERLVNLVNTKTISYEMLKRLKHEFENKYKKYDNDNASVEYILNGGDVMKRYVNQKLEQLRSIENSTEREIRRIGLKNNLDLKNQLNVDVLPQVPVNNLFSHGNNDLNRLQENKIIELMKKLM